jgi:hypothetical protein
MKDPREEVSPFLPILLGTDKDRKARKGERNRQEVKSSASLFHHLRAFPHKTLDLCRNLISVPLKQMKK